MVGYRAGEKIDCGEAFGGIREVASGLQKHYTVEQMTDRPVLVLRRNRPTGRAG